MSLYFEGADVLQSVQESGGSIKSAVFSKKERKCDSKALFALTTEAVKWSQVLSQVIDNSGLLKVERQVCDMSN
jgi:25S rRNA (cytosine2278-C5)-methyltransferase